MRRLRGIDARVWDWVIAFMFVGAGVLDAVTSAADGVSGTPVWNVLCGALVGGAVLIRRRRPLTAELVWMVVVSAMALVIADPDRLVTPFLGIFLFPFAVGYRRDGVPAVLGLAPIWITVAIVALTSDSFVLGDIFFPGAFGSLFWLGGRAVRSRTRLTAELHEAALRADEAREAEAARAIMEERRRIAREMHDVVAHSVSMMVVQAGGARRILERDPARAMAAAELIERTGREAMTEMRHLLGVLHADDGVSPYAPQPGLRELDTLVERARAAGLPVTLAVQGARHALPAGVDLAAYRVVQEALTNVLKHGGGAPTEVLVHYRADAVEIRIADRGDGALDVRLGGGGHGLVGMRERVRVYGGDVHADRRRGGGFEVRATLPLEPADEAALTAGARI
jgi:signal transduction histidine kinase